MVSIDKFLCAVARGRCAEALGLKYPYSDGDIRRAVAAYHPDRGGDTELSALANACAEALRSRRPLDELYCRSAWRLIGARAVAESERRQAERRDSLREEKVKRVNTQANLESVRRVLDTCVDVPFIHATPFKTLCDVVQTALGLRRREAAIVLSGAGVCWHKNRCGNRVAAREGHGIQLTSEARTILGELAASRVAGC
jgi:hypothetical protein